MPETIELVKNELDKPVRNYRKIILCLIVIIVFIASLFVTIRAYSIPEKTENILFSNDIRINTDYSLEMKVDPNILFPQGGYVKPQGGKMPIKLIDNLRVELDTAFSGTEQAQFKGTYDISFTINAENMWTRKYPLAENKSFDISGIKDKLIGSQVVVPIRECYKLINQVEEELELFPASYTGKLQLSIDGVIQSGNQSRVLKLSPEIAFDITNRNLELLGFINNTSNIKLEDKEIEENLFNLLGIELPVKDVRLFSTLLSAVLLIVIAGYVIVKARQSYFSRTTDADRIERKLGQRLVELDASPNFTNSNIVLLKSHEALLKIADENEKQIMVYKDPAESNYFIESTSCIYMYIVKNRI